MVREAARLADLLLRREHVAAAEGHDARHRLGAEARDVLLPPSRLYSYGLHSYGLCSYGLWRTRRSAAAFAPI